MRWKNSVGVNFVTSACQFPKASSVRKVVRCFTLEMGRIQTQTQYMMTAALFLLSFLSQQRKQPRHTAIKDVWLLTWENKGCSSRLPFYCMNIDGLALHYTPDDDEPSWGKELGHIQPRHETIKPILKQIMLLLLYYLTFLRVCIWASAFFFYEVSSPFIMSYHTMPHTELKGVKLWLEKQRP